MFGNHDIESDLLEIMNRTFYSTSLTKKCDR